MPEFSMMSKKKLATCHETLQKLFNEVIKERDCTIVCGHRDYEEQEKAYKEGYSKAHYPQSKHNYTPSMAVDVAPYNTEKKCIEWNNEKAFDDFAKFVKEKACEMDIAIIWGGDFKSIVDKPHYQLV